jgi:putative transposase
MGGDCHAEYAYLAKIIPSVDSNCFNNKGVFMNNKIQGANTRQEQWARFRFSIIGPLLSAPPDNGELQAELTRIAQKQWLHPITGLPVHFGVSTIERWLYQARHENDPVSALRTRRRMDAGCSRTLTEQLKATVRTQHREHPSWSYQLHFYNLKTTVKNNPELGELPSYNTVRRYMKSHGLGKQPGRKKRHTSGAILAAEKLEKREVRSYEVDYVHALWHLDFHHGSRKILGKDGKWHKPLLLAIMDDRSRLICHAQWYMDETSETLVHGFTQALQKRALPRALMTDNGAAMTSGEFTEGLARLGILHQPTLPYSPYMNAKQEVFWAQVEGRLMAMLEGEEEITLSLLNKSTQAWIEQEYHQKFHSEIASTPMERYLKDKDVGRPCPDSKLLKQAFCIQVHRKQRKSDGTVSLEGKRFEIPSQYRCLEQLYLRYASWNMADIWLADPNTNTLLCVIYPQDKSDNASGIRRTLTPIEQVNTTTNPEKNISTGIAPLLKELMAEYAATGLPPAYLPKGEYDE